MEKKDYSQILASIISSDTVPQKIDGIPVFRDLEGLPHVWTREHFDFELTILILTLNESTNIELVIGEIRQQLATNDIKYEILVVDGGSKDDTVSIATRLGARVHAQTTSGYAEGFKEGLTNSRGRYIITLDGDCSHPATFIPTLLAKRHEADIVIGSRWISGGKFEGPLLRKILSRVLNLFFRRALSMPVIDMSSGYRLYRSNALNPSDYRSRDFSILEEVLVKAFTDGFKIVEAPLHYLPRKAGKSHAEHLKFAMSYLSTLAKMWLLRNDANSADYDSRAYDSIYFIQKWWQRKRFRNITSLIQDLTKDALILDVGCGSSRIIQSLPNAVAYDYSLKKLRFLKATNAMRVCGSALNLPFKDNSFDCVIHSQLIEHLPFDDNIFHEITRVLKPGGMAIVGTVDYGTWIWPTIEAIYGFLLPHGYADEHISHFTLQSLKDTLERCGLKVVDLKTIVKGEITLKALKKV